MRVVCENCGATYKIPDEKLTKEVNKATCRSCSFRMLIRRPGSQVSQKPQTSGPAEASTVVTEAPQSEWSDEAPTQMKVSPMGPESAPAMAPGSSQPLAPKLPKPPKPPKPVTPAQVSIGVLLPMFGACLAAVGTLLLAWNLLDSAGQRGLGLFLGLFGAFTVMWWSVAQLLRFGRVAIGVGLICLAMVSGLTSGLMTMALISIETGSGLLTAGQFSPAQTAPEAREDTPSKDALPDEDGEEPEPTVKPEQPTKAAPEDALAARRQADARQKAQLEAEAQQETQQETQQEAQREAQREADLERRRAQAEEAQRLRAERAAAEPSPEPPPEPPSKRMKTLPLTVVDTMLRSNFSIKRCFVSEKKQTGSLPSRVSVRFTVLPSGSVQSSRVTNSELKGGSMDSCLRRAFKAIHFPAFEGQAMTMTYPFVL
jgi:DNA-directed RNA polymerase subunit RPC12/RpoP